MANQIFTDLIGRDMLSPVLNTGERAAQQFGASITSIFSGVAAAITGAAIAKAIFDFGVASVEAASESEDAWAKWNATQRAAGDTIRVTNAELEKLASSLQATTKFEDEAVVNAASLLSIYENLNSEAFPRTIELAADMASLFGTDLEGAAKQLGRALDDPVAGMTQLRRAGVVLDDSVKELVKSLAESGDRIGAQNLLFEQLEKRFDGVAEAMGETFSGRIAKVNNQFGELKETLGRFILPYLESLTKDLESLTVQDKFNIFGGGTAPISPFKAQQETQGKSAVQERIDAEKRDDAEWEKIRAQARAKEILEQQWEDSIFKARQQREGDAERAAEADRKKDEEAAEQRRIEGLIAPLLGAGRIRNKQQEEREEFTASFEDITETHRRISSAAASGSPIDKVREAIVEEGARATEKADAQLKIDEQIRDAIKELPAAIAFENETGLA